MSINYKKLNKDFKLKGSFIIKKFIDDKKIIKLKEILSELFLEELKKTKFNISTFKDKKKLWENPKFCELINIFHPLIHLQYLVNYKMIRHTVSETVAKIIFCTTQKFLKYKKNGDRAKIDVINFKINNNKILFLILN